MSRPGGPGRGGPGRRGPGRGPGALRVAGISFRREELRDLAIAWVALSVAFAILFAGGGGGMVGMILSDPLAVIGLAVASFLTAGLGFMVHELAHKVVAVRYGQTAAFRANYQMLAVAVLASLAGFIFAAPGAVHHAGRITEREQGLIALAGPVSNMALVAPFLVVLFAGVGLSTSVVFQIGLYGVLINCLLAGFNMLPFGPLDGASVRRWSTTVYAATAIPTIVVGVAALFFLV